MLREALLRLSRNLRFRRMITTAPVASDVVSRYVAGDQVGDAVAVTRQLVGSGLRVSVDHLGEDTTDAGQAQEMKQAYVLLLHELRSAGLAEAAEVSVKLSALGQLLGRDGERIATDHAAEVCAVAREVGTTVTVDMEDHTTTDSTLGIVSRLRKDFPDVGAVLQAYLHRTVGDCRDLAYAGSRIRLCKGAYAEPDSVAHTEEEDVDLSYVRCLKILLAGQGYPMIATHDPRLIEIAQKLITDQERRPDSYEFQFLYGIRPTEQQRLAHLGHTVRVYLPSGSDWYGYLMRRLAERPANLTFFARSLISKD